MNTLLNEDFLVAAEDYAHTTRTVRSGEKIRVHLAHLGHPIVGDFLYGTEDPRLPGRFALHSTYIRLIHPVTGEVIEAESPLPEELRGL